MSLILQIFFHLFSDWNILRLVRGTDKQIDRLTQAYTYTVIMFPCESMIIIANIMQAILKACKTK